jgi:hypothetical protein
MLERVVRGRPMGVELGLEGAQRLDDRERGFDRVVSARCLARVCGATDDPDLEPEDAH